MSLVDLWSEGALAERVKIAIVGSGPAGISAAAHAGKLGVPHVLLERTNHLSDTIYKYQKRKHVMASPEALPLRSDVTFDAGARETILDGFESGLAAGKANVRFNSEVTAITGAKGDFKLTLADGSAIEAEYVILSIGLQGNLRKLTIPGADLPHVQYQLDDPDAYNNEDVIVIGGGDAGLENALGLCDRNTVTIICNQPEFTYAKPANVALVRKAEKEGRLNLVMSANPDRIEPDTFVVTNPDGTHRIKANRIIARIGALPPRKFVESCGIEFPNANPAAVPQVSDTYESNVPGLHIIGALAGYPLIKQCMNQGYEVVEFIQGNHIPPADEPLLQAKLDAGGTGLKVKEVVALIQARLPVYGSLTSLQIREFLLASNVRRFQPGEVVFERNDYTNSFWSVMEGSVGIQIDPNDATKMVTLKTGDFFGEMGLLSGRRRTATVVARDPALLLEVDRNMMIRLTRSLPTVKKVIDDAAIIRQVQTYLAPTAKPEDLQDLVRVAEIVSFKKGDKLIEEGETDDCLYLIRSGSVTISRKIAGRDIVLSYVPAGNYVGEMAVVTQTARSASVTAAVATEAIKLQAAPLRELMSRHSGIRSSVEAKMQARLQSNVRSQASESAGGIIQFLMEQGIGEATDVLLIDESLCVRCDNCEKACAETHHGVSRLDREAGPTYASIHVPTSCRHCEHPHCMKDCPPDAIHRAPSGEVFISDACIGCGNCERNCPYGVIHMAATPPKKPGLLSWLFFGFGSGPGEDHSEEAHQKATGGKHAVKCDMCHGVRGGPACVRACPTGAAIRVNPQQFIEVVHERR